MSAPKTWLQSEAIAITLLIFCAVGYGVHLLAGLLNGRIEQLLRVAGAQ